MKETERTIQLTGFDASGEPEIRVLADGTLCVVFNFMPPDDMTEREEQFFASFDKHMEEAVGARVVWEDRERFSIPLPEADTLERLKSFIEQCRHKLRDAPRTTGKRSVRDSVFEGLAPVVAREGFRLRKSEGVFVRPIPAGKQHLTVPLIDRRPLYGLSLGLGIRLDAVEAVIRRAEGTPASASDEALTIVTQLEHFGLQPEPGVGVCLWVATADQLELAQQWLNQMSAVQNRPPSRVIEVAMAVEQLSQSIEDKLLPFFERHQDIESINDALHSETASAGTSDSSGEGVWQRGLRKIVATLAGRRRQTPREDEWSEWVKKRRGFNGSTPHHWIRNLVIAHLAGNTHFEKLVSKYRNAITGYPQADVDRFEIVVRYLHEHGSVD